MLAAAVVVAASAGWAANPLLPAGMLVAPDQLTLAGASRKAQARLVPLQPRLHTGRWPAVIDQAGQARLIQAYNIGFCQHLVQPRAGDDVTSFQYRLSPEFGFGPLRVMGRLFQISLDQRLVAIDLQSLGSHGRYDLSSVDLDKLALLLSGRTPVYLADAVPADYNRVRAELEKAGWPAGPLVMWDHTPYGKPCPRRWVASDLSDRFPQQLALAVVSELEDNREMFGPVAVKTWADAMGR